MIDQEIAAAQERFERAKEEMHDVMLRLVEARNEVEELARRRGHKGATWKLQGAERGCQLCAWLEDIANRRATVKLDVGPMN